MRKIICLVLLLLSGLFFRSYSIESNSINRLEKNNQAYVEISKNSDTGSGHLTLTANTISNVDNELIFFTSNISENKMTYIYVENCKVFEQKIINGEIYSIDISSIKEVHKINGKTKVQLIQYDNDKESGNIVTFKQACYKVVE